MNVYGSHCRAGFPVEFAKRGITTVSEANRFLETEYRELFNQRFAVEPEAESIFVSAAKDLNLDSILCVKHTRKTDATRTFSFKNRCFQILDEGFPIINARREITVLINPRFGIRVEYGGRIYNTIRYLKPQNKNANTEVPQKVSKTVEPHLQSFVTAVMNGKQSGGWRIIICHLNFYMSYFSRSESTAS